MTFSSVSTLAPVDVVGVGINATGTTIRSPHFPSLDPKVEIVFVESKSGGHADSAIGACARWGLLTRYIGKIAEDDACGFQRRKMRREHVDAYWVVARDRSSQTSFILFDQISGERTVLWSRDPSIAIQPCDPDKNLSPGAKALLVDGHDTSAAARAVRWAREEQIPVVGDFGNICPQVEAVLKNTRFPAASKDISKRLTGTSNGFKPIPAAHRQFKCHLIAATLGRWGSGAWNGVDSLFFPGLQVQPADTAGAGDNFHGTFLFVLVQYWLIHEALESPCAAAALSCTSVEVRGMIASLKQTGELSKSGTRSGLAFPSRELVEAAKAAISCAGSASGRPASTPAKGNLA